MKIVVPEDRPKLEMTLTDGAVLTLSPVLKMDRDLLERGLAELSPESRFLRFGAGMAGLSSQELDYLSDVDQRDHVAWGAALGDEAAGVGRYIVVGEEVCPEFAITVLDQMQGRGIGKALFTALVAVARADGHRELCFEASADNVAVNHLIGEMEVRPLISGEVIERRIRLSELPKTPYDDALVAVIDEVRTA